MKKLMIVFQYIIGIINVLFAKKQKPTADTSDQNIETLKAALDAAPKTEEVKDAQKKLEYIETLSLKEREKKTEEMIYEVQEVVEKEVKAKPIDENRAQTIIEKYKEMKGIK